MIEIKPAILNESQRQELLKAYEDANIIICTSWYAGEYFVKSLEGCKLSTPFKDKIFAVIGRRTQKSLEQYGIHASIVSLEETAEGLFKALSHDLEINGKNILFPRSNLPNPFLKAALINAGASVSEITIYENTKPAKRDLPSIEINGVIFTSPSTVKNFLHDYGTIPPSWQIMAKGPVTLKTLREAGYHHASSLS